MDVGDGPAVVFCHGFPEYWNSWRHQIPAIAAAGHRAIALDMRGHGQSCCPTEIEAFTVTHTVGDVIEVLDALGIQRAVIVGHDAGTTTAYHAALMRPDRISGVIGLSVPYVPRGPVSLVAAMRASMPPEFYMLYFQEPGVAEADLDANPRKTLERIFFANSGEYVGAPIMMMAHAGQGLVNTLPAPDKPMSFLSERDLEAYVTEFARTGFRGGLNGYRVFDRNWMVTSPWRGQALPIPSCYIGGKLDTVLGFPGFREAAIAMDRAIFVEGAGHWIHAERPEFVNAEVLRFLKDCPA